MTNILFDEFEKSVSEYGNIIIKNIRLFKGLTQRQLGEKIGKKEITIRSYENKNSNVTLEIIFIITRKLQISKSEFIKMNANYYSTPEYKSFLEVLIYNLYSFTETNEEKENKKINSFYDDFLYNSLKFYIENTARKNFLKLDDDEKKLIINKTITFLKVSIK